MTSCASGAMQSRKTAGSSGIVSVLHGSAEMMSSVRARSEKHCHTAKASSASSLRAFASSCTMSCFLLSSPCSCALAPISSSSMCARTSSIVGILRTTSSGTDNAFSDAAGAPFNSSTSARPVLVAQLIHPSLPVSMSLTNKRRLEVSVPCARTKHSRPLASFAVSRLVGSSQMRMTIGCRTFTPLPTGKELLTVASFAAARAAVSPEAWLRRC
mmetsp:Transcript_11546/g.36025  ORF Transcript_11546/g.36025 Transcript_11546/m.36025 type:complete len:214 (+) Transcript_11546:1188-1829(+)